MNNKNFTKRETDLIKKSLRLLMVQEIGLAFDKSQNPNDRDSHQDEHDEAVELLAKFGLREVPEDEFDAHAREI